MTSLFNRTQIPSPERYTYLGLINSDHLTFTFLQMETDDLNIHVYMHVTVEGKIMQIQRKFKTVFSYIIYPDFKYYLKWFDKDFLPSWYKTEII